MRLETRIRGGPTRHIRVLGLGLLLVLVGAGCNRGNDVESPFARPGATRVNLRVDNLDFNEATLHARSDGKRDLVGRVPGKAQGSFVLDWREVRDLQIEIDILAGNRFTTRRLTVSPGDQLTLIIQVPVSRSFLRR